MKKALFVAFVASFCLTAVPYAQQVGPSVNVISGTDPLKGDPYLQRQNEAAIALSTRNPDKLLIVFNDYSTVDMALDTAPEEGTTGFIARLRQFFLGKPARTGPVPTLSPEAWIGLAFSNNRGKTFYKALLPGSPFDTSAVGMSSPIYGDSAGSDPALVTGDNGRVYLIVLTFDRGGVSRVSSTLYQDLNYVEGGEPFYFRGTRQIDRGSLSSRGIFVDKPSAALYAGDSASAFASSGVSKKKKNVLVVPGCERVYAAWTEFDGYDGSGHFRANVKLAMTASCNQSWSQPIKISGPYNVGGSTYPGTRNQGTSIAVDPDTGYVYVLWRTYTPEGFAWVRSTDGGVTFSQQKSVTGDQPVYPFDQKAVLVPGDPAFRVVAYPSLFVYDGKLIAVWSEYVDVNPGSQTYGRPLAPASGGQPRTVMTIGTQNTDGTMTWSPRRAVDLGDVGLTSPNARSELEVPEGNPTGQPESVQRATGAQIFPYITARDGEVLITYYEARSQKIEGGGEDGGLNPQTGLISGIDRQVDLRGALVDPSAWTLKNSFQVSRYLIDPATGRTMENPNLATTDAAYKVRKRVNWANFTMFRGGLASFIGDYLHAIAIRPDGPTRGFRVVSTSNETVDPPPDLDFTKYDKPQSGHVSGCNPGSRNSTIMTTEVGAGLVVGSPGTFKQLLAPDNTPIQRAFAVYIENRTLELRRFRLSFNPVTPGVLASWEQFSNTPTVDIEVLGSSSLARTAFLSVAPGSTLATGSATVLVQEVSMASPYSLLPSGLQASLTLNGDPTNPYVGIGDEHNPGLDTTETHTPQAGTPQAGTPQAGTPQAGTPQAGTPQAGTPQASTPQAGTPQAGTTSEFDPSSAITDVTVSITNGGNTASSYNALVAFAAAPQLAPNHSFQVYAYRVTRSAAVNDCGVGLGQSDQLIFLSPVMGSPQASTPQASTPQAGTPHAGTPQAGTPQAGTPQAGTPQAGTPQAGTPQAGTTQLAEVTFTLAPSDPNPNDHDGTIHEPQPRDEVRVTLRIIHPTEIEALSHGATATDTSYYTTQNFATEVRAQAANTGQTQPDEAFIDTTPPDTTLTNAPPLSPTPSTSASFTFAGSDNLTPVADLMFQCSLDGAAFAPCVSPVSYTGLATGPHTIQVRAVDGAGNVDPTPATASWTIVTPTVTITGITPDPAAAGFGQQITVNTTGAPTTPPTTAIFAQGGIEIEGFAFNAPSSQNEYFVRLPFPTDNVLANGTLGLTPGPATVRLVFDPTVLSQAFPFTVSATPGTPVARFVVGPQPQASLCGGAVSLVHLSVIDPGQEIAISAYGIDTTNAEAEFTQNGFTYSTFGTCAVSSGATGLGAVFTVPTGLAPGFPVSVRIRTSVDGVPSAWSNVLTLTVGGLALYGVDSGTDALNVIDPVTGAGATIGPLDPGRNASNNQYATPIAMAVRPSDGVLFAWNNSAIANSTLLTTGVLVTVDRCTGAATPVNPAQTGGDFELAFSPSGVLYGVGFDGTQSGLFTFDTSTAAKTFVAPVSMAFYGFAISPNGTLYGVAPNLQTPGFQPNRLATIDPTTGAVTVIGDLSVDIGIIGALTFTPGGTLIGTGFGGPSGDILFDIDPQTAAVSNIRSVTGGGLGQGMGFSRVPSCTVIQ